MSKELEALKTIKIKCHPNSNPSPLVDEALDTIENALNRLEAIDNANPSEALECLERIEADLIGLPKHVTEYDNIFDDYLYDIENNIDTLKQALLKAQELEKENKLLKEIIKGMEI